MPQFDPEKLRGKRQDAELSQREKAAVVFGMREMLERKVAVCGKRDRQSFIQPDEGQGRTR